MPAKARTASRAVAVFLVLLGSAMAVNEAAAATIVSTFDSDTDGWTASGDAVSLVPTWLALGGNPGGTIEVDDRTVGGVWYFEAPAKFEGNQSLVYGRSLSFDLYQRGSGPQFDAPDIVLQGGGFTLSLDAGTNPLPLESWRSYSIAFDEGAGWTVDGGVGATKEQLLAVLGSLDRMRIRGEFITGSDFGRIDNVRMEAVPLPSTLLLFGPALAFIASSATWLRRRSS